MRKYDLNLEAKKITEPNIINIISMIHEYRGKQSIEVNSKKDILNSLLNVAKLQSTEYSNKIEGIKTTNNRLKELVSKKTEPENRNEEEIAGYRDVLEMIRNNYEYIDIKPNRILQLHKNLYKYSAIPSAGKFKQVANVIEELDHSGNSIIRFKPVSVFETPMAIESLCDSYNEAIKKGEIDPLLLMVTFIFDFLSIHPFTDGNGRISRLLTLLMLYKNNYFVGKYISIEKLIENSKETYYKSLKKSSNSWHEEENDYSYFVSYYLGIILNAYKELSNRTDYITSKKLTVKERVYIVLQQHFGKITKQEIVEFCPDLSEGAIERALTELIKNNSITKIGGGRFTSYLNKEKITE